MNPIKVALATPFPEDPKRLSGGVDAVVAYLVQALAETGLVEVVLIVLDDGTRQRVELEVGPGVRQVRIPASRLPSRISLVASARRIAEEIKQQDVDLVHAQIAGVYAIGAAYGGKPHILTLHGIRHLEADLWPGIVNRIYRKPLIHLEENRAIALSHNIISISPFIASSFDLGDKRVYEIENPVKREFFEIPLSNRQSANTILFVGRLIKRKDPICLIRAMDLVSKARPDVKLRIVGGGLSKYDKNEYAEELVHLVDELNLREKVEFLGELNEVEVIREYSRSDVLACVSVLETAPMVISQALASGIPVVTTDSGGCAHMIEDATTGYVAPIGDFRSVADSLIKCLDAENHSRLARNARRSAEERFSPSLVADQTIAAYRNVLSNHRQHL